MWNRIDEKIKLEILITSLAMMTSLFFISLSYLHPLYATEILSLLVIALPAIYIIGNLITKALLQYGFDRWMDEMRDGLEKVEDENSYLKEILKKNNVLFEEED